MRPKREHFFILLLNGIENYGIIFKYDNEPLKRRELKIATGTQMVLEVKKYKLNNSFKHFTFVQNKDRSFNLRSFCVCIIRINLFRDFQWLLSNATNNIKQIAKATNTTGVIYKNEIDSMNKEIEKLAKEIWQIHSLLLNKSKESSGD